ncbi:MAG TPA: aldo/keto reductase [Lachnospiraceae bacterium]|nr:aldo/keto reductase [Lachnospiraceae bacterium]
MPENNENGSLVKDCLKLGFGMMRLPRQGKGSMYDPIDVEQTKKMADAFLNAGGRYFDTAFVYEGSEEAVKQALCDRYPRDAYYLASKLNASAFACSNKEEARAEFKTSLERTGCGYFDFYLLHALDHENLHLYNDYGIWEYAQELKEKGLVKHVGFSFHDTPEVLDRILTEHPEAEFVQLQINYSDWEDGGVQSKGCYETAVKHGKPVIVMEPVKGGLLANPPEPVKKIFAEADPKASPASWAVRFAASLGNVMIVLSGMSNEAQMADNLSYMKDFRKLSPSETKTVEDARTALAGIEKIPCTSCHYCTKGCPVEMHIPEIFSVMNVYKLYGDLDKAKSDYGWKAGKTKASACVQCGQCEGACPQHLPIISLLKETAETLE